MSPPYKMSIEATVEEVLMRTPAAFANPGSVLSDSDLYANSSNVRNDVVEVLTTYGRTKISSNNLNFGAVSTFQISPQSLLDNVILYASVNLDRYVYGSSMWLLNAIQSISYQLSGSSNIPQVQISGESHRDLVMASCKSKEKRDTFIQEKYYVGSSSGASVASQAIPLYLPFSDPGEANFPLDTATLASNIVINITWRQGYSCFNGINGQSPSMPTAFSSMFLSCKCEDIVDSRFQIAPALRFDKSLYYSLPFKYCQTFQQTVSVTTGQSFSVSLSALPKSQLVGLLVSMRPVASYGVSAGTSLINPEGVIFSAAQLSYMGQMLVLMDNEEVKDCYEAIFYDGGGDRYSVWNMASYASATATEWQGETLYLPLSHSAAKVLTEEYTQNCPSYGGATLDLALTVRVLGGDGVTANPTGVNYLLNVTYIQNGIISINDQTATLVL